MKAKEKAAQIYRIDWLLALVVGLWSFLVFALAKDDFSYDFFNYIKYFEKIEGLSFYELTERLPYPYVFLAPSGLFEFGFALIVWLLMAAGFSANIAYALIGSTSIVARLLLLRTFGVSWKVNFIVAVYTITLFEANAIRLGVALTLCILGGFFFIRRSFFFCAVSFFAAALFHIQILAFVTPAIFIYLALPIFRRTKLRRILIVFIAMSSSIFFAYFIQHLDFIKISEYIGSGSGAAGINLVSVSALIAMLAGIFSFVESGKGLGCDNSASLARIQEVVLFSAVPALTILFLATNIGVVGDRVWQFAFSLLFSFVSMSNLRRRGDNFLIISLWVCVTISVINIIIRYPLSNFFYPIAPYFSIDPLWVVM